MHTVPGCSLKQVPAQLFPATHSPNLKRSADTENRISTGEEMLNAQREAAGPRFTQRDQGIVPEADSVGYCWGLPGDTGSHTQRSDIVPSMGRKT